MAGSKRIKRRKSYNEFKSLADFIESKPSTEELLKYVFNILDERRAFGSFTHSMWAQEGLNLVIEEIKREA